MVPNFRTRDATLALDPIRALGLRDGNKQYSLVRRFDQPVVYGREVTFDKLQRFPWRMPEIEKAIARRQVEEP